VVRAGTKGTGAERSVLDGIKTLDAQLANPAYVVLPVTGILIVLDGDLGVLDPRGDRPLLAMGVFAGALFGPSLRRLAELTRSSVEPGAYAAAVRRTTMTGLITMVPIAAILYMMVMKPTP
jgi:hypothetical protein